MRYFLIGLFAILLFPLWGPLVIVVGVPYVIGIMVVTSWEEQEFKKRHNI